MLYLFLPFVLLPKFLFSALMLLNGVQEVIWPGKSVPVIVRGSLFSETQPRLKYPQRKPLKQKQKVYLILAFSASDVSVNWN